MSEAGIRKIQTRVSIGYSLSSIFCSTRKWLSIRKLETKNKIIFKIVPTMSCFTSTKLSKEQSPNSCIKIINFKIPETGGSIQKSGNCFALFVLVNYCFVLMP